MKTKIEQIQEWIESTDFDALGAEAQKQVLSEMDSTTYMQMRNIHLASQKHAAPLVNMPFENRLDALKTIQQNKGNQKNKTSFLWYKVDLWKAASVALLAAFAGLYFTRNSNVVTSKEIITKTDTVYIPKILMDTLRIKEKVVEYIVQNAGNKASKNVHTIAQNTAVEISNIEGLHITTLADYGATEKNKSRNSIEGDKLVDTFAFVRY